MTSIGNSVRSMVNEALNDKVTPNKIDKKEATEIKEVVKDQKLDFKTKEFLKDQFIGNKVENGSAKTIIKDLFIEKKTPLDITPAVVGGLSVVGGAAAIIGAGVPAMMIGGPMILVGLGLGALSAAAIPRIISDNDRISEENKKLLKK